MNPKNPDDAAAAGPYGEAWNEYVENSSGAGEDQSWPGDEWGTPELWDRWFHLLFGCTGVQGWERAVEIGQGTGKYTQRVLEAGCKEVLACDVSGQFLELCRQRLSHHVGAGRLHLQQISESNPDAVQEACRERGWIGKVDGLFSMDTFVHLSFTHVVCYLLAATEVLAPGGFVVLTFADGSAEAGFQKLVQDLDRTIRRQGHPTTGCFHWITPALLRQTAERMGYQVIRCEVDPEHHRDGHFVATFEDAQKAAAARALRVRE